MIENFNYMSGDGAVDGEVCSDDVQTFTAPALEKLKAGSIVGYVGANLAGWQNPSANKFVFAGDLGAGNKVDLNIQVKSYNGENEVIANYTMAQVTYGVSHSATMDAIVTAINNLDSRLTAVKDLTDSNLRTIYVTASDNSVIIISGLNVSGGSAVATSYDFYGTLKAFVTKTPLEKSIYTGENRILPSMPVAGVYSGIVQCPSIDAVNMNSSLNVQFIEDTVNGITRGSIRTSTASGKAKAFSELKCNKQASALGSTRFELRLP